MNLDFMPLRLKEFFSLIDFSGVYEIRFRTSYPILLKSLNRTYYLSEKGLSLLEEIAVVCQKSDITEIIDNITEHSYYAYNNSIKDGFLTTSDGIRIGIAGECVFCDDMNTTIKNITSINVRIPHDIKGASDVIYKRVFLDDIKNTLIISPPAKGKTTILKDLVYKFNQCDKYSIMVIDERGEFGVSLGQNVDVIRYSNKLFAFNYGIRSMSPDIIITDELCSKDDFRCVANAVNSGVNIIASIHGGSINDVLSKHDHIKGIFDRYVLLKKDGKPGVVEAIYDENFIVL